MPKIHSQHKHFIINTTVVVHRQRRYLVREVIATVTGGGKAAAADIAFRNDYVPKRVLQILV